MKPLNYLALGDSYTIGESLPNEDNFPNQLVKVLDKQYGIEVNSPDIIAVTGWTTDELQASIEARDLKKNYDFATLLIGVNNQYRNREIEEFKKDFTLLLKEAIEFVGGDYKKVVVVSIPDWGDTPFAHSKGIDWHNVSEKIQEYNAAKIEITLHFGVKFLSITDLTRNLAKDESFLAKDGLHYSAKLYHEWAELLAPLVSKMTF